MVLSALPAWWDHISTIYLQGKTKLDEIKFSMEHQAIVANFDRTGWSGQQVQHISAIKCKGEHPIFSKQKGADNSSAHVQTTIRSPESLNPREKVRVELKILNGWFHPTLSPLL